MIVNNDIKVERCPVMKQITAKQHAKIRPFLPIHRGNVQISNIVFINAVLYVLENGCKRRALLRPRQHQRRGASRRHRGAENERAAKHREVTRRLVREDPHGLRKRLAGNDYSPVRRECPQRTRRPSPVGELGQSGRERATGDETRLRGRRDPPTRPRPWNEAGRAAEGEQESRTGLQPGNLQVSERDLTPVPEIQGLPPSK